MIVNIEKLPDIAERNYNATRTATPEPSAPFTAAEAAKGPPPIFIVAEGDSWFDYKPSYLEDILRGDLIGQLDAMPQYKVRRLARAGDTVENMIFGTDFDQSNWSPKPVQLDETLRVVREYRPAVFLFSGAGNDIAGPELDALLNHSSTGQPALSEPALTGFIDRVARPAFTKLIQEVQAASPGTHIFLHGYDYAVPDGRGVFNLMPGFTFVGPWLRPAFVRKRILQLGDMQTVVNRLIDRLNELMIELEHSFPGVVHHIDVRNKVGAGNWANELHPTVQGFANVAAAFDAGIQAVLATS